jgi:nitroreductase
MSILYLIKSRRSIREFRNEEISDEMVREILEAGRWAPSGLNNQPWKFIVVKDVKVKNELANFTKYRRIIENSKILIVVFLDKKESYDRTKDIQAIGACIQNMLLQIHSLGLGSCWIGEILNQREKVESFFSVPESFELMAVLAIGYPEKKKRTSTRKSLEELIYKEI